MDREDTKEYIQLIEEALELLEEKRTGKAATAGSRGKKATGLF